jgi:hypothetical protein
MLRSIFVETFLNSGRQSIRLLFQPKLSARDKRHRLHGGVVDDLQSQN